MKKLESHRLLGILISLSALYLLAPTVAAQTNAVDKTDEIKRALERAEYQIAAELADSAIVHFTDYTPEKLAAIYTLRALVAWQQGEVALADAHFMSALQLNYDHQLDPVFFSPALQKRFALLRAKMPRPDRPAHPETRYVMLPDPRVNAAWKSLLIPGWGQSYKGQKTRGRIYLVAAAALAGGTLTAHLLRRHAESRYLEATGEAQAQARYKTFNHYHLLRNNLALALGLTWGASVLDALIFKSNKGAGKLALHPALQLSPDSAQLSLRLVR